MNNARHICTYRDIPVWEREKTHEGDTTYTYLVDNPEGLATIWNTLKSAYKCIDRIVEGK